MRERIIQAPTLCHSEPVVGRAMAFEVTAFETSLEILGQRPEWQSRLRKMLVDDELAALRQEMYDGFARLSATVEAREVQGPCR